MQRISMSMILFMGTVVWGMMPSLSTGGTMAVPMTSEFTYQGYLEVSGAPYTGTADFLANGWEEPAGGAKVTSDTLQTNVSVVEGVFTLALDFGVEWLNSDARWLEIAVRAPAGSGNYVPLLPRQAVTAAPYALQTRGLFVTQDKRVLVGSAYTPTAALEVFRPAGPIPVALRVITNNQLNLPVWLDFLSTGINAQSIFGDFDLHLNNTSTGKVVIGGGGGDVEVGPAGNNVMIAAGGGNVSIAPDGGDVTMSTNSGEVGIGTANPEFNLHVAGSFGVKSGTNGIVLTPVSDYVALEFSHAGGKNTRGRFAQTYTNFNGNLGINNINPAHPLHVGTTSGNGNGAHVTTGGVWTNGSDVNSKQDFEAIDGREMLEKVAALPVTKWRYIGEGENVRHIGPMAQDFMAAFGLGESEKHIGTVDADGVALAAIQGLNEIVKEQATVIAEQRATIDEQAARLEALDARLTALESK